MLNRTVIITESLEKGFGFSAELEQKGICSVVVEDDAKEILEAIGRLEPGAVLLPTFLPMQDAVNVIGIARQLQQGRVNTLYFVAGGGESIRTINYIINHGADYYFHVTGQISTIAEKILCFLNDGAGQAEDVLLGRVTPTSGEVSSYNYNIVAQDLLREVGVLPHLKGFCYLNDAVVMGLDGEKWPIPLTNEVYPALAEKHGTTQLRVERAIRNAILVAWANFDRENASSNPIFIKCTERPSNREFLGLMNYEIKKRLARKNNYEGLSVS